jgi:hypothetical protein
VNAGRPFVAVDFAAAFAAGVPCAGTAVAAATVATIANDDARIDQNAIFTTLLDRYV